MAKGNNTIKPKDGIYCRKCEKIRNENNFYEATNPNIDTNNKFSVCKDCINDIFNSYFELEKDLKKSIFLTCRDLDIGYYSVVCDMVLAHMEGKNNIAKIFGVYKSKLSTTAKENGIKSFRFQDGEQFDNTGLQDSLEKFENDEELILSWGKGFSFEDFKYLEYELANWTKTHKCDTHAELTLLREICIKKLSINKLRELNKNTSSEVKELQQLMVTANVDPAKANLATSGKLLDCYGMWVKDIEQFRPAEWHDKQEKYKDMDGFVPYLKDMILRPIMNFLKGSFSGEELEDLKNDNSEDGDFDE